MAEQKTEAYKKKQDELRVQYEKEQELHENKCAFFIFTSLHILKCTNKHRQI